MPYKDPDVRRTYARAYYLMNRAPLIRKVGKWSKKHRVRRNEAARIRNAERYRTDPEFREHRRTLNRLYYRKHHIKRLAEAKEFSSSDEARARQVLRNALRRKEVVRPQVCNRCGITGRIEAHHPDYAKPLDVLWLCRFCHGDQHRREGQVISSSLA